MWELVNRDIGMFSVFDSERPGDPAVARRGVTRSAPSWKVQNRCAAACCACGDSAWVKGQIRNAKVRLHWSCSGLPSESGLSHVATAARSRARVAA